MSRDWSKDDFRAGFIAGFAASREGYNGEHAQRSLAPRPNESGRSTRQGDVRWHEELEALFEAAWDDYEEGEGLFDPAVYDYEEAG